MDVVYKGKDAGLASAASFVSQLWQSEELWDLILQHRPFDYATIQGSEIVSRLRSPQLTYTIEVWKPSLAKRLFYRNTVALTDPAIPFVLFYHDTFLGNSAAQKAGTIAHEFVHNIDNHDGDANEQMGHGDNDWHGKENSLPYWLGGEVESLYRQTHPAPTEKALATPAVSSLSCVHGEGSASDGEVVDESGSLAIRRSVKRLP